MTASSSTAANAKRNKNHPIVDDLLVLDEVVSATPNLSAPGMAEASMGCGHRSFHLDSASKTAYLVPPQSNFRPTPEVLEDPKVDVQTRGGGRRSDIQRVPFRRRAESLQGRGAAILEGKLPASLAASP
eukprot:CAMPEP_0206605244 /NCGR_PEP_ID=MMETSP0325_2-20121206/50273_1 /ASSEMBLY_ACC=CAM_ASM_000347 /TAXON_ID=2866 /ORGANISM="Crypthecodinium cohnii, Strain Seligo" /LENGTH=128 /DNA_ID=CAMNT_0054120697 /DNA_START=224 /DNA_END=609 /DNA_ORIENTATION=+